MAKLGQELRQEQGFTLSAAQLQVIKMMELTGLELEARIEKELVDNPALEEDFYSAEGYDDPAGDYDGEGYDDPAGHYKGEGGEGYDRDPANDYEGAGNGSESDQGDRDMSQAGEHTQGEGAGDYDGEGSDSYRDSAEGYDDLGDRDEGDRLSPISDQDWELGEYAKEDDIPEYKLRELSERTDPREDILYPSAAPSLQDLLMEQLTYSDLSQEELQIADYIVGNLTAEGYLSRSLWELEDELLFRLGLQTTPQELERIIARIKELDPPGIGSAGLQESLIIQLSRRTPSPIIRLAIDILQRSYDDFTAKRYEALMLAHGIPSDRLAEVYSLVAHLNPWPTAGMSSGSDAPTQVLVPDFWVGEQEGQLQVQLLSARQLPTLRISPSFADMLSLGAKAGGKLSRAEQEAITFARHKVEQARAFIDAVAQRQETLYRTMRAIAEHQRAFFTTGELADLRPMVLREIAEVTGLDISTISRVTSSKSVQTPFGIYPLKYFFGEGITNDEGESISTKQIKQALQELIEGEDKSAPLSDEALVQLLTQQGYPLARRTVTKYREQLRLPVARLRRELS